MDSTRMVQSNGGSGAAVRAALQPTNQIRRSAVSVRTNTQSTRTSAVIAKPVGYGLPCATCKTYYLASLTACPICNATERVSPIALIPARQPITGPKVMGDVLSTERENFLRDFNAKHATRNTDSAAQARCIFSGEDETAHKSAEVCKTCYEDLQERLDLFEAALHIDLNEAAQVIYEAVWADTSDSNKTYINAARALLGELRKRAGLKLVLGSLQPLTH